jgi:hypothetical protein
LWAQIAGTLCISNTIDFVDIECASHYRTERLTRLVIAIAAGDARLRHTLRASVSPGVRAPPTTTNDGDLLIEAERMWPKAKFVATDIDSSAIRRLSRLKPSWTAGRCDLRYSRSRNSCFALQQARGRVSLLLLNPPFSCRGGTKFPAETETGILFASAAMSFVVIASNYVAKKGEIVAILPFGCLYSAKDGRERSVVLAPSLNSSSPPGKAWRGWLWIALIVVAIAAAVIQVMK